jgi:hypothetical protein
MYILSETKNSQQVYREYVCDDFTDLKTITNSNFGDIAIVINPASIYLKNSKDKRIEL